MNLTKNRLTRGLVAVAGAGALAFAAAAPANATISSVSPSTITSGSSADVDGTVPSGATAYSLAICNTVVRPVGTGCSAGAGTYTSLTSATGTYRVSLTVNRRFLDYSFIPPMGFTGGRTTCRDSNGNGDQCAVIANYYVRDVNNAWVPFGAPSIYNILVD